MNFIKIRKKTVYAILITIFFVFVLAVGLRGNPGNFGKDDFFTLNWQGNGPFESSNDRGRFALTFSFVEDKSLNFSIPVANFAAPDLAITEDGRYASLFAPGVSFLIIPGYIVGKYFNVSQLGAFAVVALFALLNALLIYLIAKKVGAQTIPATLGALSFLFATPAFTYAVSLSQHHFSVFTLLFCIYLVLNWNNWWSLSAIWFMCAASIVIDNPNFFFLLPIGLFALGRIFYIKKEENGLKFIIKPFYIFTFLAMLPPLIFFGWFNKSSNGSPFQLAGTLERVLSLSDESNSVKGSSLVNIPLDKDGKIEKESEEKTSIGFFETRNMFNGFYVHFVSRDRGILWFTPVVLFGVLGLIIIFKKYQSISTVLIASVGMNVLLYSMWGDPWGGWAFGSRYLIPSYALLSIGIAIALTKWRGSFIFLLLFFMVFVYSVRINTLGALGTSAIPPKAEVLALEELSGTIQKYDFERSRDYIKEIGSKSFVYKVLVSKYINAYQYYNLVSGLILFVGGFLIVRHWFYGRSEISKKQRL